MDYTEVAGLEEVYLEDSFVLAIRDEPDACTFWLEAVLTPTHPAYQPARPGEYYCFRRSRLIFHRPRSVTWLERHQVESFDANGEFDLGNIDSMVVDGDTARLEGSWGVVEIALSRPPQFVLDD